jgi:hypothetical protein
MLLQAKFIWPLTDKCYVSSMTKARPHLLDAQECALLLLRLIEMRNAESPGVTRVRLSELTLKRLWGRDRISRELLEEIQEWLSRGGWSLFYARTTYAAVRTSAVLSWVRLSSKRMVEDLKQIRDGSFDFSRHLHLIGGDESVED